MTHSVVLVLESQPLKNWDLITFWKITYRAFHLLTLKLQLIQMLLPLVN